MRTVVALGLVVGFGAVRYGAVQPLEAGVCFAAIGAIALVARPDTTSLPLWARAVLLALPAYALLQLIPLPQTALASISTGRLRSLHSLDGAAPLSVTPAATFRFVLGMVAAGLTYLLVRSAAGRLKDRTWVAAAPLIVLGAIEAILGVVQQVAGDGSRGVTGTFVNRNHYAGLLEMCLPFAVVGSVCCARRPMLAAALGAISLLMLVGVFYSLSRMGLVAVLVSMALVASLLLPKRRWTLAASMVALVVIAAALAPARLADRLINEDGAASRTAIWRETTRLIADYPWFGCGLGAFESGLQPYRETVPMLRVDYAHNDYLQIVAEAGVAGASLAAALLWMVLTQARRAAAVSPVGIAAVGALAAILVHSLTDFNLYIPSNMLVFAWVSGLAGGLSR
jgi:O-antigen ligase